MALRNGGSGVGRVAGVVLATALVGCVLVAVGWGVGTTAGVAATLDEPWLGDAGGTSVDATLERPQLEAGPGVPVDGRVDLRPGDEVTVRVVLFPGATAFETSRTATVDRDGAFRAVFDLSDVLVDAPAEVAVAYEGETLTNVTTTVGPCRVGCDPSSRDRTPYDVEIDGTDGEYERTAGPGRTVTGVTDLPAGSEVTVRMLATGEQPFLETRTATVSYGGTFRAVFDLHDEDDDLAGTAFDLEVYHDGTELANTTGTLVQCRTACEPPEPPEPQEPRFADGVDYRTIVDRGETHVVPVELHGEDRARVEVTADDDRTGVAVAPNADPSRVDGTADGDGAARAAATLEDGTGDDRVVLMIDTGPDGGLYVADHGDDVTVENRTGEFLPGVYDVRLGTAGGTASAAAVSDVSLLGVEEADGDEPAPTTTPTGTDDAPYRSWAGLFAGSALGVVGLGLLTGALRFGRSDD